MNFPTLYAVSKSGKIKVWNVSTDGANVIVEHGQLGGKQQTMITTATPKNVGRANETTAEFQATLEANAKWVKQFDKKYRETTEEAQEAALETLLPMLAHDYTKVGHRISYPCYVSPKLDGLRCIAEVNFNQTDVTFHSRGGKTFPVPEHLKKEILYASGETGIMIFDGELYIHGMTLQNITSCVKKHNENTKDLVFCVFDVPSPKVWDERIEDLYSLCDYETEHFEVVTNDLVGNEKEARVLMNIYLAQGYEGMMLRNVGGKYEWGNRSGDLQKWKDFQDIEAKVISVSEDKLGEGKLLCRLQSGVEVECKMRGTHEYRLYSNMVGLIGSWVNIRFQAYTDAGSLQFPVATGIRECDNEGNPLE